MRVCLTLEYDGTDFAGFQLQGKGERTVQGTLEAAIHRLAGKASRVHCAGRTDAGVHAAGQVAHFDTEWTIPEARFLPALNTVLPRDLIVKAASEAPAGFHSRFDATARVYRYTVLNRVAPSALLGRYSWHVEETLDLQTMQAAAMHLTGTHDFAAFGRPNAPGKSTVRRVDRIAVVRQKDCVQITVRGNAFLRQMVRSFVGTLVLTGQNRLTPDAVRQIRESGDRGKCPNIAPAQGLCLMRVEYGDRTNRYTGSVDRHEIIESLNENLQDTDHEDLFGEAE